MIPAWKGVERECGRCKKSFMPKAKNHAYCTIAHKEAAYLDRRVEEMVARVNSHGTIHFARLSASPRLQRFRDYLLKKGNDGATGLELVAETQTLNPHTSAAELRANGIRVECDYQKTQDNGAKIYRYFLREKEAQNGG